MPFAETRLDSDDFGHVETLRLSKIVASLIRHHSLTSLWILEVTVEVCMPKGPQFDSVLSPATFTREVAHESRRDLAVSMSGVDNTVIRQRAVMRKHNDLSLRLRARNRVNFFVEPLEICKMRFLVRCDRPVPDIVEIIHAKADIFRLRIGDS